MFLSIKKREQSRIDTLSKTNLEDGLWVFGYGSLMWKPEFPYIERMIGKLEGYHRDFCVWAIISRGTPEKPGLSLGLKPGGMTHGMLFKIAPEHIEKVTIQLWEREIITGILLPKWLPVKYNQKTIEALIFVVDETHAQFADLNPVDAAPIILKASGKNGTCFEYLDNTIKQLINIDVADPYLNNLLEYVLKLKNQ
jgi:glutathione-specific gamma-glutamylcyclotransferase